MDRKYYKYWPCHGKYKGVGSIQYEWGHQGIFKFTTTYDSYYDMLLYEEDGKFYEFLTGEFLGVRKPNNNTPYIFSDKFGYVLPLDGYTYCYVINITAERFAECAQSYMKDKDRIIPCLERRFDKWRKEYQEELAAENSKERVEAAAKAEAESWIDNMLNNRK